MCKLGVLTNSWSRYFRELKNNIKDAAKKYGEEERTRYTNEEKGIILTNLENMTHVWTKMILKAERREAQNCKQQ